MFRRNFLQLPFLLLFKPQLTREIHNIDKLSINTSYPITNICNICSLETSRIVDRPDININIVSNGINYFYKGYNKRYSVARLWERAYWDKNYCKCFVLKNNLIVYTKRHKLEIDLYENFNITNSI